MPTVVADLQRLISRNLGTFTR